MLFFGIVNNTLLNNFYKVTGNFKDVTESIYSQDIIEYILIIIRQVKINLCCFIPFLKKVCM